ncbi:hypothetical protein ACC734_03310 [Rhizobium ruizarguesonis]
MLDVSLGDQSAIREVMEYVNRRLVVNLALTRHAAVNASISRHRFKDTGEAFFSFPAVILPLPAPWSQVDRNRLAEQVKLHSASVSVADVTQWKGASSVVFDWRAAMAAGRISTGELYCPGSVFALAFDR